MEFQLFKKIAHIFTLALPLAFVACGVTTPSEATPAPTQATVAAKSCAGSYVGTIDKPSLEIRLAAYEESLRRRGIVIRELDVIQVNLGPQEGFWLDGSFAFETDANCNVVKGGVAIFGYPFEFSGTVSANRAFDMSWIVSAGTQGAIVGQINPDDTISGQVKHPREEYIYGLMNGTFTPNGKI
jgi:hypothetical protein